MTDDEILAQAEKIKARRERAAKGRKFMQAHRVSLVMYLADGAGAWDSIEVPQDANLAALLCRVLDCEITEGLEAQD